MALEPLTHQIPILEKLKNDRKLGKTLIVIPSGAGKTHVAAFDSLNSGAKSILYVAHRKEILEQAADIFKSVHNLTNDELGFVNNRHKDFDKNFIFASNTALAKPHNLERIDRVFDYTIIDEFHHVSASTYQKILSTVNSKFVLGLTATPFRLDGRDILKDVDNNVSYNIDLEEGIDQDILVPFNYHGVHDNIDYSDIRWRGNKYSEGDLNRKLLIDQRDELIVQKYKEFIGTGKTTIGFCVSVTHCERMNLKFKNNGINSRYLTYLTPLHEREQIVKDFSDGKFDVLFVKDMFNEGLDFPHLRGIMFLRPTYSKTVFFQQLGRGLRTAKDKTHVVVLDFIGNYYKAFQHREWLKSFIRTSSIEPDLRPIYRYNTTVTFDSVLIDIFKIQQQKLINYNPTKEELINQYWNLKKLLNRYPTYQDLKATNAKKYGIVLSVSYYEKIWGSWRKFLDSLKIKKIPTRHELILNYYRLKMRLGRRPTIKDLVLGVNQYGHGWVDVLNAKEKNKINGKTEYSKNEYDQMFGSWSEFLKLIGEYDREISREDLLRNYYEMKEKLGRRPKYHEFDRKLSRYSSGAYEHKWRNYRDFLTDIGEIEKDCHPRLYFTKQDVMDNFNEVTKKLGRPPRREELWDKKLSKYSVFAIQHFWGTWGKFLEEMGIKLHQSVNESRHRIYTPSELKAMVKKLQSKLGKKEITFKDWTKEYGFHKKLDRMYGSFFKFQQAMGIYPQTRPCILCNQHFTPIQYREIMCRNHTRREYQNHKNKIARAWRERLG